MHPFVLELCNEIVIVTVFITIKPKLRIVHRAVRSISVLLGLVKSIGNFFFTRRIVNYNRQISRIHADRSPFLGDFFNLYDFLLMLGMFVFFASSFGNVLNNVLSVRPLFKINIE